VELYHGNITYGQANALLQQSEQISYQDIAAADQAVQAQRLKEQQIQATRSAAAMQYGAQLLMMGQPQMMQPAPRSTTCRFFGNQMICQ